VSEEVLLQLSRHEGPHSRGYGRTLTWARCYVVHMITTRYGKGGRKGSKKGAPRPYARMRAPGVGALGFGFTRQTRPTSRDAGQVGCSTHDERAGPHSGGARPSSPSAYGSAPVTTASSDGHAGSDKNLARVSVIARGVPVRRAHGRQDDLLCRAGSAGDTVPGLSGEPPEVLHVQRRGGGRWTRSPRASRPRRTPGYRGQVTAAG
jgi:hypothetical protein